MRPRGVRPNAVTYNAAITLAQGAGRWELGLLQLGAMREAGLRPTVVSCTAAVSACGKSARWRHSLDLADRMFA